jgi:hypothetical protein
MGKYLKKTLTILLFGLSASVYSQSIFVGDIGGSYDETESHLDLMGSLGFYLYELGSLYIRPELEFSHKSDAKYDSYYGGLHLSALYGYNIEVEPFSLFLYGGAGVGYNLLFSGKSGGSGFAGNGIFGAKLLLYGLGPYIEYRKSFSGDADRLSIGLTFAIGDGFSSAPAPAPAPYIPPAPPNTNNNNRDRDYFSYRGMGYEKTFD